MASLKRCMYCGVPIDLDHPYVGFDGRKKVFREYNYCNSACHEADRNEREKLSHEKLYDSPRHP